jgi:hypothetical protein
MSHFGGDSTKMQMSNSFDGKTGKYVSPTDSHFSSNSYAQVFHKLTAAT